MKKKHSKRYLELVKGHNKLAEKSLSEAIKLLKTKSTTKLKNAP